MHDVQRDLPRVIHISMAVVTVLFTLANVSYFVVLEKAVVARSNTVALVSPTAQVVHDCMPARSPFVCPVLIPQDFGAVLLGPAGGITFSVCPCSPSLPSIVIPGTSS